MWKRNPTDQLIVLRLPSSTRAPFWSDWSAYESSHCISSLFMHSLACSLPLPLPRRLLINACNFRIEQIDFSYRLECKVLCACSQWWRDTFELLIDEGRRRRNWGLRNSICLRSLRHCSDGVLSHFAPSGMLISSDLISRSLLTARGDSKLTKETDVSHCAQVNRICLSLTINSLTWMDVTTLKAW
jgi:hypothetical protein